MDVFISWSGQQSKLVAETLHHFLPLMINAIRPWLSSADIDAGARWATDIAGNLEKSRVGILCLTPTNLDSIWIHFEAGALAKTVDNKTFVIPYLHGCEFSAVQGPLTQFQAKKTNEGDTKRLLEALNSALSDNRLKQQQLDEAFGMWWPKLKEELDAIGKEEPQPKKRGDREILEEVLELVRSQARQQETQLPLALPSRQALRTKTVFRILHETLGEMINPEQHAVLGRGKDGTRHLIIPFVDESITVDVSGMNQAEIREVLLDVKAKLNEERHRPSSTEA